MHIEHLNRHFQEAANTAISISNNFVELLAKTILGGNEGIKQGL